MAAEAGLPLAATTYYFASRDDLISKLLRFIADYDQNAKPFKWTYAADPLVA